MQLKPPPRFVPMPVRINALFGGFGNQFGWFFFGFGMIFFSLFCAGTIVKNIQMMGPQKTTRAVISEVKDTNFEVNETEVVAHYYEFTLNGEDYTGVSYVTGRELNEGSSVRIVYKASNPNFSYIKKRGFRLSQGPWWIGLFVGIFPVVGLCFIIPSFRKGKRDVHLMTHGKVSKGRLVKKVPTNTEINDETVYKLTFQYEVNGKKYTTDVKTHNTEALEDDAEESLLYLPKSPELATMVDNIAGSIKSSTHGGIQAKNPTRSLMNLVTPIGFTLLNLLALSYAF